MPETLQQPVDVTGIEQEAYKLSLGDAQGLTCYLLGTIGQRRTTAAVGLKDARTVKAWAAGTAQVREAAVEVRLRALYRAVWMITEAYAAATAAAWLESTSPYLGDRSPLVVLAQSEDETAFLAAARALLEG